MTNPAKVSLSIYQGGFEVTFRGKNPICAVLLYCMIRCANVIDR